MKKHLIPALAAAVMMAAPALRAADQMVFVNLNRVFEEYHKTEMANKQLKAQADEFSAERSGKIKEFEELQAAFDAARDDSQNPALSAEARDAKRDEAEEKLIEIRRKEKEIRKYEETRKKQLMDTERRVRNRIVGEIRDAIKAYAIEQAYSAVIDSSGQSLNAVESIVYHDARLEITDKILEILNKGADQAAPIDLNATDDEAEEEAEEAESGIVE
ncbi:MAG TPA: OmpH family outer membrane protein [Kiritimatiellia bacterium]|nr:OmpH family outer membrane protein [Kiritimatiellia bacterium]HPA78382.1 OmpH family outer membrane protein [Kiritimatiellia bacterium]